MIDLIRLRLRGISPVGKRPFPNPTKNFVELRFAHEEGIVLGSNVAAASMKSMLVPLS